MRALLHSLCAGLVVVYYSESLFWSGLQRNLDPLELLFTLLVYSLVFYIIRRIADAWGTATTAGWFLLGAVYGWLVEGVIVQTMYSELPFTISWTALGWHAPLSIVVGWLWMRRWLRSGWRSSLMGALVVGLFQGLWSLSWWQETVNDPAATVSSIEETTLLNIMFGMTLIIGYIGADRLGKPASVPSKWGILIAIALLAAWFVIIAIPTVPISALVLPACLVPTLLILRRVRHTATPNDDPLIPPLPRYVALLLIPLVASATYALLLGTRIELQTLFGIVLIPLGFLLLVVALWRVWGRRAVGA